MEEYMYFDFYTHSYIPQAIYYYTVWNVEMGIESSSKEDIEWAA